jgi:hypothetical protein
VPKKNKSQAPDESVAKRIKKIEKKLAAGDLKKKARRELEDELAALSVPVVDIIDEVVKKAGKAIGEKLDKVLEDDVEKFPEANLQPKPAAEEVVAAVQHPHLEHLSRVGELNLIVTDSEQPKPLGFTKAEKKAAQKELDALAAATLARQADLEAGGMNPEPAKQWSAKEARDGKLAAETPESDDDIKARVQAKRALRAAAEAQGATVDPEPSASLPGVESAVTTKAAKRSVIAEDDPVDAAEIKADLDGNEGGVASVLADPVEEQPRDRWGRPLIVPAGGGKAVGYKRTTTFIDVLDDKTALKDWANRIVVTGVAAIEQKSKGDETVVDVSEVGSVSVVDRVIEANRQLAKSAKKADKQLKKGEIDEDEHAKAHDDAEKAHKSALRELVNEAFEAGEGFVKAETGTRIHLLTELHDTKQPMPDDVTESELRDVAAYAAALKEINAEILAVEQFVVIDEFQVGGTLDRRLRYDSPALGRRITAIGDVKTGRVDFGAGKMTRQLAAYAMGKGYDHTKPEERVTFRTNREYGLIFHLPAGSGVCTVYEIDLKKGLEGLRLCAQVFAHRSETTTSKVFTAITGPKATNKKEN